MKIDEVDLARRRAFAGLSSEDWGQLAGTRDYLASHADEITEEYFEYLRGFEEAHALFRNAELLERCKALKRSHLREMAGGKYGLSYMQERVELAITFSEIGLDVKVFIGAFLHMLRSIGIRLMREGKADPEAAFAAFMSVEKVGLMDLSAMVDVLIHQREKLIRVFQATILELSTPVLQVWQGVLCLPLIGTLDSQRTQRVMEALLDAIAQKEAEVVILDISGVPMVDTAVAQHLLKTIQAARLMGAETFLSGVRPETASAMVHLGVDLGTIVTRGTLREALTLALERKGRSSGSLAGPDVLRTGAA